MSKKASQLLRESADPFDEAYTLVLDYERRAEFVAQALHALGRAYRHDWSQVDGRQLLNELEVIAAMLNTSTPLPYFGDWCDREGIKCVDPATGDYEWQ